MFLFQVSEFLDLHEFVLPTSVLGVFTVMGVGAMGNTGNTLLFSRTTIGAEICVGQLYKISDLVKVRKCRFCRGFSIAITGHPMFQCLNFPYKT